MLSPLSALYAAGWIAYQSVYNLGLKKAAEPHKAVITVGNLIAGGSGKTPTTVYVAGLLRKLGTDPVVSVSGYGAPRAREATIAPDGELSAKDWGDEAAMFRWFMPDLTLVVGRDRVLAATLVHERWPDRVMLMDDGFQHLRLKQPATIVLDPNPANNFCMPSGPYREPRSLGLKRAGLVLPNTEMTLTRGPTEFRQVSGPERDLQSTPVNVLCALARPYRLVNALQHEGFETGVVRVLPDHDPLSRGTLLKEFDPKVPLVVTAKDWVKLRERKDIDGRIVFACWYDVRVEPEGLFEDWIRRKLDGFREQATT